jgi:crossover junction endodeoxyribonuclease RusA
VTVEEAPRLHVRLTLPYSRPPAELAGNARVHWRPEAKAKQQVRNDVTMLARSMRLHRYQPGEVEHVALQLVWAPGDNRKRDSDNLWKLQKVCADALARGRSTLVGIDLVPDDAPRWMDKLAPLILPPPAGPAMWLDLWLLLARPASEASA